jgi:uncharacterized protein (TIGR02466 family)
MTIKALFPTHVYTAALQRGNSAELNRQIVQEARQLREDDAAGRRWSSRNYPGGYTSYGSAHHLQRHIKSFAESVEWDLTGRKLQMTDCWVNIMGHQVVHGLHLHPLSTVSGTYYVQVPARSPGIKFEDPRLDRLMAAPPRKADSRDENQSWITLPAVPGQLVLFESWLRHEVVPNPSAAERVSVSFNYNWF